MYSLAGQLAWSGVFSAGWRRAICSGVVRWKASMDDTAKRARSANTAFAAADRCSIRDTFGASPVSVAQGAKEGANVIGEQLWLLKRREMAASRHLRPALKVI